MEDWEGQFDHRFKMEDSVICHGECRDGVPTGVKKGDANHDSTEDYPRSRIAGKERGRATVEPMMVSLAPKKLGGMEATMVRCCEADVQYCVESIPNDCDQGKYPDPP